MVGAPYHQQYYFSSLSPLQVFVGQNLGPFDVGALSYVSGLDPGLDIIPIVAGVVVGVVGMFLFFLLVICIMFYCYQRKGKEGKEKVRLMEVQLHAKDMELTEKNMTEGYTALMDP